MGKQIVVCTPPFYWVIPVAVPQRAAPIKGIVVRPPKSPDTTRLVLLESFQVCLPGFCANLKGTSTPGGGIRLNPGTSES